MRTTFTRIKYGMAAAILGIGASAGSLILPQTAAAYGGGNGTSGSPWQITTCTQLHEMGYESTDGESDDAYVLANDINCSGIAFESIRFGEGGDAFSGTFDGAGHTISNLTINQNDYRIGLFSSLSGATVHDLTISGASITGRYSVGTLAGQVINETNIHNVHVIGGTVTGTQTEDSAVGGLVGHSTSSSYERTSSSATVSGHQM